jgi:ParB-like chromosome segregation protein Spo0J
MRQFSHAIEDIPINARKPYPRNARCHSKAQIKQIAASIERFGFVNPVLTADDGEIVAGHGRVAAAKLLGLAKVPVLRLAHLSEVERRAYVIADNKLAQNAGWDREILAIELQGLIELDFDVELTGFSLAEADIVLEGMLAVYTISRSISAKPQTGPSNPSLVARILANESASG